MLDIHVLILPGLPEEWIQQRRDALNAAVASAGFPVFVHEVEGIPDHLGASRKLGYSQGDQPYVTHVDHDDYVLPNAFSVLHAHIMGNAPVITTGEIVIRENGNRTYLHESRHHLAVFRRDVINTVSYERMRHFPDQLLLRKQDSLHIPECVYVHRVADASASRVSRAKDPQGVAEEQRIINSPELLAVEFMTPAQIKESTEEWLNAEHPE